MHLQNKKSYFKKRFFILLALITLGLFSCHPVNLQEESAIRNSVQVETLAESGVQEESPLFYLSFLHHLSLEKHTSLQKESEYSLLWTLEDGSLIKVETELAYRSELLSYAKRKELFAEGSFLSDLEDKEKNIQVLMKEHNPKLLELQLRQSLLLPFQNIENTFSNAAFLLEEKAFPALSYRSNLEGTYTLSGVYIEKESFLLMQIGVADDLCDMENGDEIYLLKFSFVDTILPKEQVQEALYKAFQSFVEKIENGAFMKKACAL